MSEPLRRTRSPLAIGAPSISTHPAVPCFEFSTRARFPASAASYPATVTSVEECPTSKEKLYAVQYADCTSEAKLPRARVKAVGEDEKSAPAGGVIFLDEAYDLDPAAQPEGRAIVNELMSVSEEFRDKVSIVLAGYREDIEKKLFAFNPGMPSRFVSVHFPDFSPRQLADIWKRVSSRARARHRGLWRGPRDRGSRDVPSLVSAIVFLHIFIYFSR